jgi:hypothetical protein
MRVERAAQEAFGSWPEHYDTLAFADMGMLRPENVDAWETLTTDLQTAIGLHGAEKVLVFGGASRENCRVARLLKADARFSRLNILPSRQELDTSFTARPLLISCMDWRLHGNQTMTSLVAERLCIKQFHLLTTAGVAKELTSDTTRWRSVEQQVSYLTVSGLVNRIILLNHDDCGKYGGSCAFESALQERGTYASHLAAAAERLGTITGLPVEKAILELRNNKPIRILSISDRHLIL